MTDNSKAPERIWADARIRNAGFWACDAEAYDQDGSTEYLRADIHATALAEKDAEIARLTAESDEAQTDLGKVIMSLPTGKGERAAGAVEGVKMMRTRLEAERDAALAGAVMVAPLVWVKDYKRDGTPFWQSDWGHVVLARGDNQFLVEHMLFGLRKDALQWAQEQHEARIRAAITADPDALQAVTAAAYEAARQIALSRVGTSQMHRVTHQAYFIEEERRRECKTIAQAIRAITPADALAAQSRRDAQMMAKGAASAGVKRHTIAEIRAMDGQTDWDAVRNAGDYDGHDETEPEVAQSDWVTATPTNDAK